MAPINQLEDEMKKQFKWREGSRSPRSVPANKAAMEFERIRKSTGSLTPIAVVDASRPEDAVLHPAFEWDDSRASELYRQHQASSLIRAVVVVTDDSEQLDHRKYVLVTQADDPQAVHYVPAEYAAQQVDLFADALGRLESKVRELQSSIREFESLAKRESKDPERMARIGMAVKALETASAAIAGLH